MGFPTNRITELFALSIAEWVSFFDLSDRFCMDSLLQISVKAIMSFDLEYTNPRISTCCLDLAIRYPGAFTEEYRNTVFRHLIAREQILTVDEMRLLGWELGTLVTQSRELVRMRHFAANRRSSNEYRSLVELSRQYTLEQQVLE